MLNTANITPKLLKSMSRAVERAIGQTSATADIVNDAIVAILTKIDSFDSERGSFESWSLRIASNTARNWRKASSNNGHDSGAVDDEGTVTDLVDVIGATPATMGSFVGPDGREAIERAHDAAWLASAIETLESDERAFLAAMADGMGQTDAGKSVGWSPATSTRRYRAIVETLSDLHG
jgi:RNA polymerase sigma factor (sigma-70 family)